MEKLSKHELVLQCEKYQRKLQRYEARFAALVDAYKNLTDEKNVLENTLKTLSSLKPTPKKTSFQENVSSDDLKVCVDVSEEELQVDAVTSGSYEVHGDDDNVQLLEEKLTVLSSALHSVTEAKAKMETAFQADKKSTLLEHSQYIAELQKLTDIAKGEAEEMRCKLCSEQHDREEESKAHSSMLMELQELLSVERLRKEELGQLIDENNAQQTSILQKVTLDYEEKVDQLNTEVCDLKEKLQSSLENPPDSKLEDLEGEIKVLKMKNREEVLMAQERANQAEDLLKTRAEFEEQRICELETHLSELSETVGSYDSLRQQDQKVIRELRDHLEKLDGGENHQMGADRYKIADLEEQLRKLKNILKITWKTTTDDTMCRLSSSDLDQMINEDTNHYNCQAEFDKLKQEFEQYKKKCKKEDRPSTLLSEYKAKVEKLEKVLQKLQLSSSEDEKEHLRIISTLQVDCTQLQDQCEEKMAKLKEVHREDVEKIEWELKKQRERTLDLLAERDSEIERLRERHYEDEYLLRQTPRVEKSFNFDSSKDVTVLDEITKSPTLPRSSSLFHYTEKLAERELDLSSCRKQVIDLESSVCDMERREDQLIMQMQMLKDEIRTLERNRSRESANLEYLKNLCLQYMLSDCSSKKRQMSHAIATILMFSPSEINRIERQQKNGWW